MESKSEPHVEQAGSIPEERVLRDVVVVIPEEAGCIHHGREGRQRDEDEDERRQHDLAQGVATRTNIGPGVANPQAPSPMAVEWPFESSIACACLVTLRRG